MKHHLRPFLSSLLFAVIPTFAAAATTECSMMSVVSKTTIEIKPSIKERSLEKIWSCFEDAVKSSSNPVSVILTLQPITYYIDRPLTIPRNNRGLAIHTIIAGNHALISGALTLSSIRALSANEAKALNSIESSYKLWEVEIPSAIADSIRKGFLRSHGDTIDTSPSELIVDDKIYKISHWPKNDYLLVESIDNISKEISTNLPVVLQREQTLQLQGTLAHDWADSTIVVSIIKNKQNGQSKIKALDPQPKYGIKKGGRFELQGNPSLISSAGEYAVHETKNTIIFSSKEKPKKIELTSVANAILGLNVSNLRIQNIQFTGTRGSAIDINGRSIAINNCHITNTGTYGMRLSGTDILIDNCTIKHTGATGIEISGGDRRSLKPGNITLINSEISDIGRRVWSSVPAVRLNGVGNSIKNNLIKIGPHAGIFYFGNDHIIEGNDISEIALRTGDVGAIYTGRDWAGRGHIVRNNFIHNIRGVGALGATALYIDDQSSGVTITENIVKNVYRGVLIGGGRDNIVSRNYFVDTKICIRADSRGLTWQADTVSENGELRKRYLSLPIASSVYTNKYPRINNILSDMPGKPVGNSIVDNFGLNCDWLIDQSFLERSDYARNVTEGEVPPLREEPNSFGNLIPIIDWQKILSRPHTPQHTKPRQ